MQEEGNEEKTPLRAGEDATIKPQQGKTSLPASEAATAGRPLSRLLAAAEHPAETDVSPNSRALLKPPPCTTSLTISKP